MNILIEICNAAIELFIVLFFFRQTLERRNLKNIAYWSVFCGILLIHIFRSFFLIPTYINLSISVFICGSIAATLFEDKSLKKLSMLLIYIFVLLMSDVLARFIISALMGITYKVAPSEDIQRYIGMIISNFVCFVILSYIAMIYKRKNSNITAKYWIMMLLFPVFSLFIIISTDIFIMLSGIHNIRYVFLLLLVIVGLLYFNIIVFEFIDTYSAKIQLLAAKQLIDKQTTNYHLLEINEKELRSLRHDIKNHISIAESMIKNNSITASQQIINSLKKLSSVPMNMVYTDDITLDSILNVECKKAVELGIEYLVKTNRLKSSLNIEPIDKSTILCNAIDNAIEACEKVDEKFILIDIASDDNKITVCIENPSLPLKTRDNSVLTTKTDSLNHGLGIASIQYALSKYNGKINISYENGVTTCVIILDNSAT